jgi:16S rRNA (cytidine1402-2'-O)-methyltransferase
MSASLFVVATPIGNLDDITLRALSVLKSVSLIAAEDTRRTAKLLHHFGITTPSTSLHAHNERLKLPFVLKKLSEGNDVALVSDAGTPVVADPGQRLIAAAIAQGVRIVPVPGASAVMAALVVSGLPADDFLFVGFAPARSSDRTVWLRALAAEQRAVVFFEAPHRIQKTIASLGDILVDRPIIVCRELTKLHEEVIRGSASEVASRSVTARGEFVIVIGPADGSPRQKTNRSSEDIYSFFCQLTENSGTTRRQALAKTAEQFGLSTNEIYALVERFKKSSSP